MPRIIMACCISMDCCGEKSGMGPLGGTPAPGCGPVPGCGRMVWLGGELGKYCKVEDGFPFMSMGEL